MNKQNKGNNETNTNSNSIKDHTRPPIQSNWKHTKVLVLIKEKGSTHSFVGLAQSI
jgi:hypothetical protein